MYFNLYFHLYRSFHLFSTLFSDGSLLCLQGGLTSTYIWMLSRVGERMALRMRCRLFDSLVKQGIAFFDQHRTGELVSRFVHIASQVDTVIVILICHWCQANGWCTRFQELLQALHISGSEKHYSSLFLSIAVLSVVQYWWDSFHVAGCWMCCVSVCHFTSFDLGDDRYIASHCLGGQCNWQNPSADFSQSSRTGHFIL